ncbi:hypothetical protein LSUE1_G003442 [Lachnellula suecica]|uniref:Uncharacterized protein n=1 Tax=Lachnellula suecica TaxID=602035 RepID=A0A8T9C4W4_9HELO|nr:hypothetical protein LSUE1_G003442 [Lachnellula suecica]
MSAIPSRYDPLVAPATTWSSRTSTLNASPTGTVDPSTSEPAFIKAKWGIGSKTPALMAAFYILTLAIAVTHLLLFRHIDGKEADGPHRVASQAWITTSSNILANAFGYSYRSALAIAFAQHLWYLLRQSTMKVSTIESLFSIRANPFQLFKLAVLRATPLLCTLAFIIYINLHVLSSQMGNGSGVEANAFSLLTLTPAEGAGFVTGTSDQGKDNNLLTRLARQVLIGGNALAFPSPCGANCSYTTGFEGPWIECNNTQTTNLYDDASQNFTIYSGQWISQAGNIISSHNTYNGTYSNANFNSTTLTPLVANGTDLDGKGNTSAIVQLDNTLCLPGRAKYTVNHTYKNNIYNRTVTAEVIDRLINLNQLTHDSIVPIPGFTDVNGLGTTPANWSSHALAYYRDNNMMAIFTAMMSWLEGEFVAYLANGRNLSIVGPGFEEPSYQLAWVEAVNSLSSGSSVQREDGTIIDSTRFNAAFDHYSAFETGHLSFNITQDVLNDYLFNITTSVMTAYGNWKTNANATQSTTINIYSFSQPLNLILPYFISLAVGLPFMLLGTLALFRNGVSAIDGGFMQIITTSTGSAVLDRAAAGGCLGGSESATQELKDLKIRFGEFVGRD